MTGKHIIRSIVPVLAVFLSLAYNGQGQLIIRDGSGSRFPVRTGKVPEVIKVDYGSALFSKKVKGTFTKTGDMTWTETTIDGDTTQWEETIRKTGTIYLYNPAAKRDIQINISDHTINRAGSLGSTLLYAILDIKMGTVQQVPGKGQPVPSTLTKTPGLQKPLSDSIKDVTGTDLDIPDLNVAPVYHAFLIAEDKYSEESYHSLPGTVRDVRRIYELLTTKYTFDPENVEILVSASKGTILSKLNEKVKALSENDNLFIFYAGHGWIKKYVATGREEGFLIPSDAKKGDEVSFINSYDITSIINRCKAKHILFTADACFAGSLFRDIPAEASMRVKEAYKEKSRRLLSSGNLQAVADESDFVESLRIALQENHEKYVTAGKLIDGFKDQYIEKTHMQLQYTPIPNVDDQGGEFVFIRR